ncbi:hypothetical protein E2C01_000594 [Portunus trituberculatus]|uniref:Uncharacterized protein n=1 Tax=Portunus trituberculatus TaxID=210409 RepID=A0A5B7CFI2_PORTR|nr:hypothetical protein [Portunus trituberculatus]
MKGGGGGDGDGGSGGAVMTVEVEVISDESAKPLDHTRIETHRQRIKEHMGVGGVRIINHNLDLGWSCPGLL